MPLWVLRRVSSLPPVDISTVAESDDGDERLEIANLVDDPVVPDTDPIELLLHSCKPARPRRPRVLRELVKAYQ